MLIPKRVLVRDPAYLKWIREQPCVVCGKEGETEAAHIRLGAHAGKSEKPGDDSCVPLCGICHREQHSWGELSWWESTIRRGAAPLAQILQAWRRHAYQQWKDGR